MGLSPHLPGFTGLKPARRDSHTPTHTPGTLARLPAAGSRCCITPGPPGRIPHQEIVSFSGNYLTKPKLLFWVWMGW